MKLYLFDKKDPSLPHNSTPGLPVREDFAMKKITFCFFGIGQNIPNHIGLSIQPNTFFYDIRFHNKSFQKRNSNYRTKLLDLVFVRAVRVSRSIGRSL